MKYKPGDKVKIKTWGKLRKENLKIDTYKIYCTTFVYYEMKNIFKKLIEL